MIELIPYLSLIGKERYHDWILLKASYEQYSTDSGQQFKACILKQTSSFVLLQATRGTKHGIILERCIIMLAPSSILKQALPTNSQEYDCTLPNTLPISQKDLEDFLNKTKDSNPLHKKNRPVIPGLLILDQLLSYYQLDTVLSSITIYFLHPILLHDSIQLQIVDQWIIGTSNHIPCFKLQF